MKISSKLFSLSLLSGSVYLVYVEVFEPFGIEICANWGMDLFGFFYMQLSSLTSTTCLRCFLLSTVYVWLLYQKPGSISVWTYVWVFSSVDWSVYFCSTPCWSYNYSSIVQHGIRTDYPSNCFFIQHCFNYPGFFVFPYETENCPSVNICVGILMVTALSILIAFGKMAIFTILILPIHEHGRSFHFLRYSSISFFKDQMISSYESFTCLG